jgi:D-alanyl-D-alanine carboxypeptidase (penicillin-binding protein 5/6)
VCVLAVVVAALVVVGAIRLSATPPAAAITPLDEAIVVPGSAPLFPWPTTGQAAVSVPSLGFSTQSGTETPVPIASLVKVMTVYQVLLDHPLPTGEDGPTVAVTGADVAAYAADVADGSSALEVQSGEALTERQLLDGAVVRSANNWADILAVWDAGTVSSFVARMNATAQVLGLHSTHYADDSGVDPGSTSTPSDQLTLTATAMALPTFAALVGLTSVDLPVVGSVSNETPSLGSDGVIGVKSGFTSEAGGCDVMALRASVAGIPVLVLSAVTGQPGGSPDVAVPAAGQWASAAVRAALAGIVAYPVARAGAVSATAVSPGHRVPLLAVSSATVLALPGQGVRTHLRVTDPVRPGSPAHQSVGTIRFTLGAQSVTVGLRTAHAFPGLSLVERLF